MRPDRVPQFLLAACLSFCFAAGLLPAPALAAEPVHVGKASFDAAHQLLTVPVSGPQPHTRYFQTAPRHYAIDLQGCELAEQQAGQASSASSGLVGWSLAPVSEDTTVRLRLTLATDAAPKLCFLPDSSTYELTFEAPAVTSSAEAVRSGEPVLTAARLKQAGPAASGGLNWPSVPPVELVVGNKPAVATPGVPMSGLAHRNLPFGTEKKTLMTAGLALLPRASAKAPARPAPAGAPGSAALGAPHYDAQRGCLVVPVAGSLNPARLAVVRLDRQWAYLDVPKSHPSFGGVRYQERTTAPLRRWVMAKRPHGDTTRLAWSMAKAADVKVHLVGHELLLQVAEKAKRPEVLEESTIGRPFFDRERFGLVIPFAGPTPHYHLGHPSDASATLEMRATSSSVGNLVASLQHNPLVAGWKVESHAGTSSVSVAIRLRRPAELTISVDVSRHELFVTPRPRGGGFDEPTDVELAHCLPGRLCRAS